MTAVPAGTAERVLAMAIPSVCPSVTIRYRIKSRWDRDSWLSPNDCLESLVSYEVIWCRWVGDSPRTRASKHLPLEIVILPLLARVAWKRLQIDRDLLLIITSTADELSGGTNIDNLERPWTPKIGVLVIFSWFHAAIHILRANCVEITGDRGQDNLRMKFSSLNVDFNSASFDPLGSRSPPYERIKFGYLLQKCEISATVD